jgi:transposase-like protein
MLFPMIQVKNKKKIINKVFINKIERAVIKNYENYAGITDSSKFLNVSRKAVTNSIERDGLISKIWKAKFLK